MLKLTKISVATFWLLVLLVTPLSAQELLLFGGSNHDEFLGSLTASRMSRDSVWNQFGKYGSQFNAGSIWNRFGTYGSKFNNQSPWNEFSSGSSPPVVVDRQGKFYGYFTANKNHPKRTRIESLVWMLDNHEYVLDNLDEIRQKF